MDKSLLLVWSELDHSPLEIGVKRREDFTVRPEIGMTHVRTFRGSIHPECDVTKVVRTHLFPLLKRPTHCAPNDFCRQAKHQM